MPALTPAEPPTFAQAMHLAKLSSTRKEESYMSTFPALTPDYAPGKPLGTARTFGGHAFAQAIWAASISIDIGYDNDGENNSGSGLRIHEANGYWPQPGYGDRPFTYEVTTVSRTRSYALCQVTARQPTTPSTEFPFPISDAMTKQLGPVALCLTCSFKRRDKAEGGQERGASYGLAFDAEKYGELLRGVDPGAHPREVYLHALPGAKKGAAVGGGGGRMVRLADFPGIDVRTPDLRAYNKGNSGGTEIRGLHMYRSSSASSRMNPHLVAAAHAYVSDRAGLDLLRQAFGAEEGGITGSLNHKIIFHVAPDDEEMAIDNTRWFTQEMWSSRGGEGRGLIESRIWSPAGVLVATTIQDGVFRKYQAKLA
ncbi:thioesterase-like superfamily-domain-containing protein [Aspergillus pseudoustus]|uniref:Thioesterase-like superfamily-domain-containing protein n=1 Tax=Aspergillus pseudoustus TaxID=1810923 RepID=A0ABR4IZL6_9EURO